MLASLRDDTLESSNIPTGFYTRIIAGATLFDAAWQSRTPADRELFLRLIVGSSQITTDASRQAIPKAFARARRWYELIVAGEVASLPDIARREKINYAHVKKIFPLAMLSPTRVEQIFAGQDSAPSLEALLADLPMQ